MHVSEIRKREDGEVLILVYFSYQHYSCEHIYRFGAQILLLNYEKIKFTWLQWKSLRYVGGLVTLWNFFKILGKWGTLGLDLPIRGRLECDWSGIDWGIESSTGGVSGIVVTKTSCGRDKEKEGIIKSRKGSTSWLVLVTVWNGKISSWKMASLKMKICLEF